MTLLGTNELNVKVINKLMKLNVKKSRWERFLILGALIFPPSVTPVEELTGSQPSNSIGDQL